MKGKISEVFRSIQGEGLYQGVDQVFVRFFGCNLGCSFCDTKLDSYEKKTAPELFDEIDSFGDYHSLSITGGEPLLQIDFLKDLLKLIKEKKQRVYLETNGTLPENLEKIIDYADIIAMDFKLPSSTSLKPFWKEHREFLRIANKKNTFAKAVIGPATEPEDIYKVIGIIKEIDKDLTLVLQPQDSAEVMIKAKLKDFEKICKKEEIDVTIIPQMHKKLGLK